jgi:hypothetical protein
MAFETLGIILILSEGAGWTSTSIQMDRPCHCRIWQRNCRTSLQIYAMIKITS